MYKKLLILLATASGLSAMNSTQWEAELNTLGKALAANSAHEKQINELLAEKVANPGNFLTMATRVQRAILEHADKALTDDATAEYRNHALTGLYFILRVAERTSGLPNSDTLQLETVQEHYNQLLAIMPATLEPTSFFSSIFTLRGGIIATIGLALVYQYTQRNKATKQSA